MKSFFLLTLAALSLSFQVQAAVQNGEVCKLKSIQKDEIRGLPGLLGATALHILSEKPFYNNAPNFPVVPTRIGLTLSGSGARSYETAQYTSFVDMNGRAIEDMNNHEGEFYAVYTHVYQDNVPGRYESSLTVKHFQYVNTDHWSSIKAVVRYQYKSLDNSPSRAFADQVYTFKCAGADHH